MVRQALTQPRVTYCTGSLGTPVQVRTYVSGSFSTRTQQFVTLPYAPWFSFRWEKRRTDLSRVHIQ